MQSPDDQSAGGQRQTVLERLRKGKDALLRRSDPGQAKEQEEGPQE